MKNIQYFVRINFMFLCLMSALNASNYVIIGGQQIPCDRYTKAILAAKVDWNDYKRFIFYAGLDQACRKHFNNNFQAMFVTRNQDITKLDCQIAALKKTQNTLELEQKLNLLKTQIKQMQIIDFRVNYNQEFTVLTKGIIALKIEIAEIESLIGFETSTENCSTARTQADQDMCMVSQWHGNMVNYKNYQTFLDAIRLDDVHSVKIMLQEGLKLSVEEKQEILKRVYGFASNQNMIQILHKYDVCVAAVPVKIKKNDKPKGPWSKLANFVRNLKK